MSPTIKIWLAATRPKTLAAAIAPVIVGAALAYGDGAFHLPSLLAIICSSLFIQVGTNFANDYFDFVQGADTEDRVGPTRATQAGLVTPRGMLFATAVAFGFSALFGLYLVWRGGVPILIIGIASIAAGILYTAGPYALGYLGLGDIFVLIFFGPVAVGGTYYLQTGLITPAVLVAGFGPGLLATAILVVNNYRDRFTDVGANKKTLVVRFGETFGIVEFFSCVILGSLTPLVLIMMTNAHYGLLICLLTLIPAIKGMKSMCSNPTSVRLNEMLGETGKLMVIYSILFALGMFL